MSHTSFITGIIIWLVCCILIGYMGKERKMGPLLAFLIPFISGILLYGIQWLIHFQSWLTSYSLFHVEAYRFLFAFSVSLIGGYAMVKISKSKEN